jgi:hypothetical protein
MELPNPGWNGERARRRGAVGCGLHVSIDDGSRRTRGAENFRERVVEDTNFVNGREATLETKDGGRNQTHEL